MAGLMAHYADADQPVEIYSVNVFGIKCNSRGDLHLASTKIHNTMILKRAMEKWIAIRNQYYILHWIYWLTPLASLIVFMHKPGFCLQRSIWRQTMIFVD